MHRGTCCTTDVTNQCLALSFRSALLGHPNAEFQRELAAFNSLDQRRAVADGIAYLRGIHATSELVQDQLRLLSAKFAKPRF